MKWAPREGPGKGHATKAHLDAFLPPDAGEQLVFAQQQLPLVPTVHHDIDICEGEV